MSIYSSPWKFIPILSVAVLLAGCLNDNDEVITPAASTLSGTAATGAPIVGGVVTVDCASGDNLAATTDTSGNWNVTISGQTAPCAVRVVTPGSAEYFSVAPAFNSVVNVTPLTSLIVAKLAGEDPATWFGGLNADRFAAFNSTTKVDAAVTAVTTALGLNTALGENNPIRTAFTATNGNVIDDVLEAFQTALTNAGTNFATLLADVRNATITPPAGFNSAFATAFSTMPSGGGGGGGSTGNTCVADITANVSGISAASYKVCYTNLPTGFTCNQAGAGSYAADYANTIQGLANVSFSYQFSSAASCPSNALVAIDLNGAGSETGGNTGGTLPVGLSSKVFDLTYQNAQNGSPFKNGDVLKFTFSSSGILTLGDTFRSIGSSTVSGSEYVWFDSANNRYFAVSLKPDGSLNEINVAGSANGTPWYGQFAEPSSGNGGGLPANLGTLSASNNGATQFGASFAPTSLDSVADIGLGWQYKWSVSATHYIQLSSSTVSIFNGNPTWQKPLAPSSQLAFDAVNGTVTFTELTTTTALGGAQSPLVLNGTLKLTPMNSGPITLAGTGVNFTGSGFDSPVATLAETANVKVWTWQDSRGTTMKLTHVLTNGNYQLSFTGMGATPYLSTLGTLNALGISIDNNGKTITFTNTSMANNNTSTAVTVNGVVRIP